MNNVIKKHELTRPDKEEDRMKHVRTLNANAEPVFFSYPAVADIDRIVREITRQQPEYDFTADDDFGHKFWVIDNADTVNKLQLLFEKVPAFYVADGHHRTAAAALVGNEKKKLKSQPHRAGRIQLLSWLYYSLMTSLPSLITTG
jgi:uncharacterized protein (DUF1015 family)